MVVVYATTPYAILIADRLQFYDRPAGYKGHGRATPYLGGAPVMIGFVLVLLLLAGRLERTAPLVGGVGVLWVLGTLDDRQSVSPAWRVIAELALGSMVWACGLGWNLHAGSAVDLGLTCLWVLGVVNAFNLFDNMDGAASTMALVVASGVALLGIVRGEAWLSVAAVALAGACLGFLPRNLCLPARIFLGDGGSMPLGFVVAVLVMVAAGTSALAWQSLPVALLLVGVPALDTSLVIVSRRRRGVSVLAGGRDHLTHRARKFLPSARAVALSLGAGQAVISVVAVLASRGGASFVAISASAYLLAGGGAIVLLEKQTVEQFGEPVAQLDVSSTSRADSPAALACLVVLGLGAGLSPFLFAYYDAGVWVPIGLGLTLAAAIAAVARPARPSGPAALGLGCLLALGVWSLSSAAWAESVENAVVSGNRWLVYGSLLLLVLVLLRSERRAAVLLGAAGLGVCAVALSVLVRLLGSNPGTLFLGARLNSPLGYINGEGCLFVMGFWLCMAAAESRRALVSGPAAGMATLMACLAMLSQSRGTALAMLCSMAVVVALTPGRTRRLYALLVVAGGVTLAAHDLLRVYSGSRGGSVAEGVGHAAGHAALLAVLGVGVVWTALGASWEFAFSASAVAAPVRRAASWLLVVFAVLALIVAGTSAQRIESDISDQWHSFTHLASQSTPASTSASQSRLLSGAGNRYDYWRIAWRVWSDHPLLGVGAGNYARSYYEQRATTEDIEQPHSVELQALSELGLVGALLLSGFIVGVFWGAVRMRAAARRSPLLRALTVGGLGAFTAWLAQTSVDWMHLLPGLTAIALIAAAALIFTRNRAGATARSARDTRTSRLARLRTGRTALALGAVAVIVTLIVSGASLSREGLSEIYRSRAEGELGVKPVAALVNANRSLEIDSDSVQAYYIKAAALARFNEASAAEAALRAALMRAPRDFVTWTLLGDIALRRQDLRVARRDYDRAHQLNPRDLALVELAVHPSAALE
jgi:UDP-GlcNAc:undecaprenyl-phosphate GlcNAc-1-phosphate transferase